MKVRLHNDNSKHFFRCVLSPCVQKWPLRFMLKNRFNTFAIVL